MSEQAPASLRAAGGSRRLPGLDHLRAFAIVFVFLYHYRLFANQPAINALGSPGWSGVDLFFVLSGFLIASQLFNRRATSGELGMAEFYGKRLFRTLPPYLVVLALYYAVPGFIERASLPPFWKLATFTLNLDMVLWRQSAFSHAWSLCVEEHFYLLLPLGCAAFLRPGWRRAGAFTLALLFLAGAGLRAALWQHAVAPVLSDPRAAGIAWYRLIYYPTWTRLDGLLVGVAIAALLVFRPAAARLAGHANQLLAGGVVLLCAAGWLCQDQQAFAATVLGFPAFSLGYGCLVLSAASGGGMLGRFDSRVTRFLAGISYPLYLTHKSIVHLTLRALAGRVDPDGLPAFAACCATALVAAAVVHYAVERPALRLRNQWLRSREASEAR